jgi:alpha-beta hydrolase superfamily lysophospholipase
VVAPRAWSFDGTDGTRRAAVTWLDDAAPPRSVVLLAHGYGEHAGRYQHVADALVDAGAVVHAVDHVGHGQSEGERVLVTDYEDVVTDLHVLDEKAREQHPGLPVALVGHSMGGLIAARYAQRYGSSLAALVLSGPLVGEWQAGPALLAMDELPDDPLDTETLSTDPEVGRDYQADPLVWHGPFKRPTLQAMATAVEAVQTGPSVGDLPLLWVHGVDDPLVPMEGSRVGIAHLRGSVYEEKLYPGMRHEVFNGRDGGPVVADVVDFLRRTLDGVSPAPARG